MTDLTSAAGWLWAQFGKGVATAAVGGARKLWEQVLWSQKEADYRDRLLEHYSTTKLLGNPKDIRIEDIYTDTYVLDKLTAMRRLSVEELMRESGGFGLVDEGDSSATEEAQDADELPSARLARKARRRLYDAKRTPLKKLALRERRIYILGKPGAGKSTFLKHVVLLCCRGEIKKTPIFVPMKVWSDSGLDLIAFIEKEFEVCQFPSARPFITKLLQSGKAIVLFDGLDEVNQEGDRRSKTIATLTQFARSYPESQIFVTCRIAATDYSFEKFVYVEVADFTPEQQAEFVKKWYGESERLEQFRSEWKKGGSRGLEHLGRTPLLLALMCLAFDETLSFPRRRVEIYQEALNALLKKWDSSRGIVRDGAYRKLSLVRKEQLLARIAAETFEKAAFFIKKGALLKIVTAYLEALPPSDREAGASSEDVLQAMEVQHGILVERAFNIYAFSHLTFHEYFTARHVVENARADGLRATIRAHFVDDQWREVFLLSASLIENGDVFLSECLLTIRQLLQRNSAVCKVLREVGRDAHPLQGGGRATRGRPEFDWNSVLDAILKTAVELSQSGVRGESKAIWRARYLASLVQTDPKRLETLLGSKVQDVEDFAIYVKATQLYTECMNVALVKNREAFEAHVFALPS